uniref:protein FAR1-RELATED SEQUENCE 5-like n=1 Tax=Erigeron canadensis TaxID=72917 RepID=UPI001CB92C85|nr:protein FAR1-RELATED SEQUENCE 5-like [Erigeron canadensis]
MWSTQPLGEVNDIDNDDDENETEPTNAFTQYDRCSIIGKKFNSSDDAYTFYNEYGLFKGFGIRRHYYNKHTATNEIYRQVFVCNKQGYKNAKRMKNDGKPRCIKRTGCKATLQVTLSTLGTWVVDKFLDDHNHPLDDPSRAPQQWSHKVFHRTKECRDLVTLLSKTGVRPSEITKIVNVYKGDQDDKLTRVQCSSIINGERKTNLGKECHGIIMHFQPKAATDKDCYFAMDLNADGTFRSVFWADGRSRSSFNQFGDVVVFDVTYKTNKFSLPFAPFVGVNHHNQTILFGGALLENETESTFTWLFEHFLKSCFGTSSTITYSSIVIVLEDG